MKQDNNSPEQFMLRGQVFEGIPDSAVFARKNCFVCQHFNHSPSEGWEGNRSCCGCFKRKFEGFYYDHSWQEQLFSVSVFAEVTDCPDFKRKRFEDEQEDD